MEILMSILATPKRYPPRVRWTVDEFHEMASLPIFENRRMILVDGEILDMPPANHPHDMGIGACQEALELVFSKSQFWVRVQMALPMGARTDPVPDLAVVAGARLTHSRQPNSALLVVEVADSSLDYDTGDKANLYASGGIADYWVVDTNGRELHIFRDPVADPVVAFGHRYHVQFAMDATATVNPIALPQISIRVADLLP
jgi:Uma2 family endonuclease